MKKKIMGFFVALGGFGVANCCLGYCYEPEIPDVLKK